MRKTVAFGFVGTGWIMPDAAVSAGRNGVRRFVMPARIVSHRSAGIVARHPLASLFETLKRDIASVSPETEVGALRLNCITRGISKRFTPAC